METKGKTPENNEDEQGYKVTGDGNVPNHSAAPGNRSFDDNQYAVTQKAEDDIPGTEFNTGDKAYHDSSKEDFIKTVSNHHHAVPEANTDLNLHIDMSYKKPDGDR